MINYERFQGNIKYNQKRVKTQNVLVNQLMVILIGRKPILNGMKKFMMKTCYFIGILWNI